MKNSQMKTGFIVLCSGGHATVLADIIRASGGVLIGFLDDKVSVGTLVLGSPVLGSISQCVNYSGCRFVLGCGDNRLREELSELYCLDYATLIHPSSTVSPSATFGVGSVVMAGAVVNPRAIIGQHCIVNSGAIVEHDNQISDYVHLSPRVVLGGNVSIGACSHIGIGAVVKNNVRICGDVVVGAGAVVVKEIEEKGTYVGVPARRLK